MKVLILGGGVIGVTTAYYLRKAGHDVSVVERRDAAALETSFANGGQISWGSARPWAAPAMPFTALKWLFRRHAPLILRPRLDAAMWGWLWRMLRECTPARFAINTERMLRVARFSHECLVQLRADTGIRYQERERGNLVLLRKARDLDKAAREARELPHWGIPVKIIDPAGCIAIEPALRETAHRLAGGVYFPGDECGDCHAFTQALAALAGELGVAFHFSTTVTRLIRSGDRIERVNTNHGDLVADRYVVACGAYSPLLLRPLGITLPVFPVKGYSLTVPAAAEADAPLGTLTDETHKIVITRLGERIRAAGTAELAGYRLDLRPARCDTIAHVLRDLFPRGGDWSRVSYWTGLRPMTPDNPPVLGPTRCHNLFLNTGHGTQGWTMACGSGQILADLIGGRAPPIDLTGLTLARYTRA